LDEHEPWGKVSERQSQRIQCHWQWPLAIPQNRVPGDHCLAEYDVSRGELQYATAEQLDRVDHEPNHIADRGSGQGDALGAVLRTHTLK
jgi:hypothetical protein